MTSVPPTPPVKPSRWFKWRTRHAHGPSRWYYAHATRADAKREADDESDGIRGYDLRAIKAPPADWLAAERQHALNRAEAAVKHADWLRTELARHYPGHR